MKIKNILIAGGTGELGNSLTEYLKDKVDIFILDKKIKKKIESKKIKYFKIDLFKNNNLKKIPKNIDVAFFFIGITGGPNSLKIENLKKYMNMNCETLLSFLKIIKKQKVQKIVFTSTEHVYGDNTKKNFNALEDEPNPKNFYGVSKLLSEKILFNFFKNNSISIDILRFPRVISLNKYNLISRIKESVIKKKLVYLNKSNSAFNFIYIDDFLSALKSCMLQKDTKFRILNLFNNSKPIRLKNIIKIFKKELKINFKVKLKKNKSLLDHNPNYLVVSNKSTKRILKWKPKFSNHKIINKIIGINEVR